MALEKYPLYGTSLPFDPAIQTVEDFNGRYDILYNKSSDSGSDDPEEDHVLRSFTDDPEIPLKQIMVCYSLVPGPPARTFREGDYW